jgi:uncharacterized damage-inducible protein DinB
MINKITYQYTKYNLWANDLLFNLVEHHLPQDKRDHEIISSFPSVPKTIFHIWDAEYIWLKRLNGESLTEWPSKSFNGNFSEAIASINELDNAFIKYVQNLSDQNLLATIEYKNIEGITFSNPVWESVMHCMNHSTYHRGQLVTMLRQHGVTNIPSTDFITFCRSK